MALRTQKTQIAAPILCLGIAIAGVGHAQTAGQSAGERVAWSFIPNVVRIISDWGDFNTEEGFGFVFGERDGVLYIATADHVIRKADKPLPRVTVRFGGDLGHGYPARPSDLRLPQEAGDLAILELPRLPSVKPVWLPTVDMRDLPLGTHAWRIGKHEKFTPAVTPGVLSDKPGGILLEFDDLDTPQGSSGGPIVTESGVVGMVITDAGNAGPATVLPIGRIETQTANWHLPWLLPRQGAPLQASVPSVASSSPTPDRPRSPEPQPMSVQSMEFASRRLVIQLFAALSGDDATALAFVDHVYGARVFADGRSLGHDSIMTARRSFLDQWPRRKYTPRPSSVTSECHAAAVTCRLDVTVDWSIQNPATHASRSGTANYTISISFKTGLPAIFAELGANTEPR